MVDRIDLIVRDVPAAAAFLRDAAGMELQVSAEGFAQLGAGPLTVMLSTQALVPVEPARGVILHVHVEDVEAALERAREHGAHVLVEPQVTDWGWKLAMIRAPEEVVIDFYTPIPQPERPS